MPRVKTLNKDEEETVANNVECHERKRTCGSKNKHDDNVNNKIECISKCKKNRVDAIKVDCWKLKWLRKSIKMQRQRTAKR